MAGIVHDDQTVSDEIDAAYRKKVAENLRRQATVLRDVISQIEADVIALLEGRPSTERYLGDRLGASKPGLSGPHVVFCRRVREALEAVGPA